MMGYFACTLVKDFILFGYGHQGFTNIVLAYAYVITDFLKLMFVMMAFGTQLFEWQMLSTMVAFQSNIEDS